MDKIRVDGSNGLRFSLNRVKGCFTPNITSFGASQIPSTDSLSRASKFGINPNKAIFTIDGKTSQILIVNNNASELLGYTAKELCEMKFSELLTSQNKSYVCALAEEQLNSEDGTVVLLSGKVVEMYTKSKKEIPVSLWIRSFDNGGRCLAFAEPVERRVCQITIDSFGNIIEADFESLMLFQFETIEHIVGKEVISTLIPAIVLPDNHGSVDIPKYVRKQKATGKTADGISFPLCLMISPNECLGNNSTGSAGQSSGLGNNVTYTITIWVFQNLSGLIVIDENGFIESCNHHFSMLMFGYTQKQLLHHPISKLIPNFGKDLEYFSTSRSRNVTESSPENESETETDPEVIENISLALNSSSRDKSENFNVPTFENSENDKNMPNLKTYNDSSAYDQRHSMVISESCSTEWQPNKNERRMPILKAYNDSSQNDLRHSMMISEACNMECQSNDNDLLTPVNDSSQAYSNNPLDFSSSSSSGFLISQQSSATGYNEIAQNQMDCTSTPYLRKNSQANVPFKLLTCSDGYYRGEAVHSDGNFIDILYTVSQEVLPCDSKIYCIWISRDPDEVDYEGRHQNLTLTFNSVTSTIEHSLGQAIKNTAAQNSSRPNSVSLMSQCEDEQISGEFNKYYTTLKQIGKGAYGYVKMAYRNSDKLLVVAKFIRKDKLCSQFMISTDDGREIPMEIHLLTTVKHPNIVTIHDVFENEKFFQLVMEKHGSGMDLFEFIERKPMIDEPLACFIFKQIANAVDYLHSLNILHRDIKDENIIIDHNFHVKLIDFGSATYMEEGKLFSTFFGTTEYCSPEVLAGNKYAGPELEIWSLGVTLYVIMFYENPFSDAEETLRAELFIPYKISTDLQDLLNRMLDKNPRTRCTMRQLISHAWINQEINTSSFRFMGIVQCESYEANPDKYYSEQIYSSATALSTTSPQDSLSLVDEDSIIDGEVVDEDEDNEENSLKCHQLKIYDNNNKSVSVQNIDDLTSFFSHQGTSSDIKSDSKVTTTTTDETVIQNVLSDYEVKAKTTVNKISKGISAQENHYNLLKNTTEYTTIIPNATITTTTTSSSSLFCKSCLIQENKTVCSQTIKSNHTNTRVLIIYNNESSTTTSGATDKITMSTMTPKVTPTSLDRNSDDNSSRRFITDNKEGISHDNELISNSLCICKDTKTTTPNTSIATLDIHSKTSRSKKIVTCSAPSDSKTQKLIINNSNNNSMEKLIEKLSKTQMSTSLSRINNIDFMDCNSLAANTVGTSTVGASETSLTAALSKSSSNYLQSTAPIQKTYAIIDYESDNEFESDGGVGCGGIDDIIKCTKYENKPLLKIESNNQLILSKSENNISDKKIEPKLGIYDVVSLNDLNTDDPFPNCKMNDLSKTKILNQISGGEFDLHELSSK